MAILSITAAAKSVGVSRTTIYEKIKDGELSRTPEGIDTAELLRVFGELKDSDNADKPEAQNSQPAVDDMTLWLREKLDAAERELRETRDELADTTERLAEHREAARSLMSPEQFNEKLEAAVNAEREESERISAEWKESLQARQTEIEQARQDAAELSERLKGEADERAKSEQVAKQLRSRGLIARLLNRPIDVEV